LHKNSYEILHPGSEIKNNIRDNILKKQLYLDVTEE